MQYRFSDYILKRHKIGVPTDPNRLVIGFPGEEEDELDWVRSSDMGMLPIDEQAPAPADSAGVSAISPPPVSEPALSESAADAILRGTGTTPGAQPASDRNVADFATDASLPLLDRIRQSEGFRETPYKDGKNADGTDRYSIGYGFNYSSLDAAPKRMTQAQANARLPGVIKEAERMAKAWIGADVWDTLEQEDREALTDMSYQMGYDRLGSFKKLKAAIRKGDWQSAEKEALDSLWAKTQTPNRARRVAGILKERSAAKPEQRGLGEVSEQRGLGEVSESALLRGTGTTLRGVGGAGQVVKSHLGAFAEQLGEKPQTDDLDKFFQEIVGAGTQLQKEHPREDWEFEKAKGFGNIASAIGRDLASDPLRFLADVGLEQAPIMALYMGAVAAGGVPGGIALTAGTESGHAYSEAIEMGKSEGEARTSAAQTAAMNVGIGMLTQALPARIVRGMNPQGVYQLWKEKVFGTAAWKTVAAALIDTGVEAPEEMLQSIAQNIALDQDIDFDQAMREGLSVLVAAGAQRGVATGVGRAAHRRVKDAMDQDELRGTGRQRREPTQEQKDQAKAEYEGLDIPGVDPTTPPPAPEPDLEKAPPPPKTEPTPPQDERRKRDIFDQKDSDAVRMGVDDYVNKRMGEMGEDLDAQSAGVMREEMKAQHGDLVRKAYEDGVDLPDEVTKGYTFPKESDEKRGAALRRQERGGENVDTISDALRGMGYVKITDMYRGEFEDIDRKTLRGVVRKDGAVGIDDAAAILANSYPHFGIKTEADLIEAMKGGSARLNRQDSDVMDELDAKLRDTADLGEGAALAPGDALPQKDQEDLLDLIPQALDGGHIDEGEANAVMDWIDEGAKTGLPFDENMWEANPKTYLDSLREKIGAPTETPPPAPAPKVETPPKEEQKLDIPGVDDDVKPEPAPAPKPAPEPRPEEKLEVPGQDPEPEQKPELEAKPEPEVKPKAEIGKLDNPDIASLSDAYRTHTHDPKGADLPPSTRPQLYALARKYSGDSDTKDADINKKAIEEAYEFGFIRHISETKGLHPPGFNDKDDKNGFDLMVSTYRRLPNLATRTSTSTMLQAYSTPAPLAYIASNLAGIDKTKTVYEPTAGTGMLLIGADPDKAHVNELGEARAKLLRSRFPNVTQNDAAVQNGPEGMDVVIANPPFGSLTEAQSGKRTSQKFKGFTIKKVDHLIAARALESMKDDGRAVLILGAEGRNEAPKRPTTTMKTFLNYVYSHYNVIDHSEVDGDLYKKQGAGWPVKVITIQGRRTNPGDARVTNIPSQVERFDDWDKLYSHAQGVWNNAKKIDETEKPDVGRADKGRDRADRGEAEQLPPSVSRPDSDKGVPEKYRDNISIKNRDTAPDEAVFAQRVGATIEAYDYLHESFPEFMKQASDTKIDIYPKLPDNLKLAPNTAGSYMDGSNVVNIGFGHIAQSQQIKPLRVLRLLAHELYHAVQDKQGAMEFKETMRKEFEASKAEHETLKGVEGKALRRIELLGKMQALKNDFDKKVLELIEYPTTLHEMKVFIQYYEDLNSGKVKVAGYEPFSKTSRQDIIDAQRDWFLDRYEKTERFGTYQPEIGTGTIQYASAYAKGFVEEKIGDFPKNIVDYPFWTDAGIPAPFDPTYLKKVIAGEVEHEVSIEDPNTVDTGGDRVPGDTEPVGTRPEEQEDDKDAGLPRRDTPQERDTDEGSQPRPDSDDGGVGPKTGGGVGGTRDGGGRDAPAGDTGRGEPGGVVSRDDGLPRSGRRTGEPSDIPGDRPGDDVPPGERERQDRGGEREPGDVSKQSDDDIEEAIRQQEERRKAKEDEKKQTKYYPASKGTPAKTLVPVNQAKPIADALEQIRKEHGDIDEYVRKKLQYKSLDELDKALFAEQVDSVAMAIASLDEGGAFIVGDQTGVGKGRTLAALIRYAKLTTGKAPIFFTKKPTLFGDMGGRDMVGVGFKNPKIFCINNVTAPYRGKTVYQRLGKTEYDKVLKNMPEYLDKFDVIMSTYSQISNKPSTEAEVTNVENYTKWPKNVALARAARGNFIFLDESHNAAGGTASRGGSQTYRFISLLGREARGVVFSSATAVKRVETMSIYAQMMGIGDATGGDVSELINTLEMGGDPLVEAVSAMVSQSGGMVRRELSYEGIPFDLVVNHDTKDRDVAASDEIADVLLDITAFDAHKKEYLDEMEEDEVVFGHTIRDQGNTSGSVTQTNFVNTVHNAIGQMLLAIKVPSAVAHAKKISAQGRKPVITMFNTMEASLLKYLETSPTKVGGRLTNFTYKSNLKKVLNGTLKVKIHDVYGDSHSHFLKMSELPPDLARWYQKIDKAIDSMENIDHLPASPLDYMKYELEKSGISMGEITGRSFYVEYQDSGAPILRHRSGAEKISKREPTITAFNDGDLDGLFINSAAAEGISLHAGLEFKDQRPRTMVVLQPQPDINEFTQVIGRINRKDQVEGKDNLPNYVLLQSALPAEIRPAAVLRKKMNAQGAAIASDQKSGIGLEDTPDIMDTTGDTVVRAFLRSNTEIARSLQIDPEGEVQGMAKKFTGRLAMMPVVMQEEAYQDLLDMHADQTEYMEMTGRNEEKTTYYDFRAKTRSKKKIYHGVDVPGSTPFERSAFLENVRVTEQGKPYTIEQINNRLRTSFSKRVSQKDESRIPLAPNIAEKESERPLAPNIAEKESERPLAPNIAEKESERPLAPNIADKKEWQDYVDTRNEDIMRAHGQLMQEIEGRSEAHIKKNSRDPRFNAHAARAGTNRTKRLLDNIYIGDTFILDLEEQGVFTSKIRAVVEGIRIKPQSAKTVGNPVTASKVDVIFAVDNAKKNLRLSLSALFSEERNLIHKQSLGYVQRFFDEPAERSANRHLVTGNIIAGLERARGRVITFSREDGGVEHGILLAENFSEEDLSAHERLGNTDQIVDMLNKDMAISNATGRRRSQDVRIQRQRTSLGVPYYEVIVPQSKNRGARFYQDTTLLGLVDGKEFESSARGMRARILTEENLRKVIEHIRKMGIGFTANIHQMHDTENMSVESKIFSSTLGMNVDVWRRDNGYLNTSTEQLMEDLPPAKGVIAKVDPELRAIHLKNHGVQRPSVTETMKGWATWARNVTTREFFHLERGETHANLRYDLRILKNHAKSIGRHHAVENIERITQKMSADDFELFEWIVLLRDLNEDVKRERPLPNAWTPEKVEEWLPQFEEEVAGNAAVMKALAERQKIWKDLRTRTIAQMKRIGFDVSYIENNENYFRHMVLEYVNVLDFIGSVGTGEKVKTPAGSSHLRRRSGGRGRHNINTSYIQAEYEVMAQMEYNISVAKTIETVKREYNVIDKMKTEAKARNEKGIREWFLVKAKGLMAKTGGGTELEAAELADRMYKRTLNRNIAIGFQKIASGLSNERDNGTITYYDNKEGDYSEVINALIVGEDIPNDQLFPYLTYLVKEHEGTALGMAAGMTLKAITYKNQFIKEALGREQKFWTWKDIVKEDSSLSIWQPREGHAFFIASSINEQIVEDAWEQQLEIINVPTEEIKKIMAVGGERESYVIKTEVAATLDNLMEKQKRAGVPYVMGLALQWLTARMKQLHLHFITRITRYITRDVTGNIDKVLAIRRMVKLVRLRMSGQFSSVVKLMPRAFKELYGSMLRGQPLAGDFRDFFNQGGGGSAYSVREIGDLDELKSFATLMKRRSNLNPYKWWKMYWAMAAKSSRFAETLLRYALYLDFKGQVVKGDGKPRTYGGAISQEVDDLVGQTEEETLVRKAYKLSNDTMGAYDEISEAGQNLRTWLIPYLSWLESNPRVYKRMLYNSFNSDGTTSKSITKAILGRGFKGGALAAANFSRFALSASLFWTMTLAWNHLVMGDDEEELNKDIAAHPHVNLGRNSDGQIRYFSRLGALGDVIDWFGIHHAPHFIQEYTAGRMSIVDVGEEMMKAFANKAIGSVTPILKMPFELWAMRSMFPDFFTQRTIRDPVEYLFQQANLHGVYRKVMGKPTRGGWGDVIKQYGAYHIDPGQAAFSEMYEWQRDFLEDIGKESEGHFWTRRQEALYNLRLAIRYGDKDATNTYLRKYVGLGGTPQDVRQSLQRMNPLSMVRSEKDRKAFLETLDDYQKQQLVAATRFYTYTLLGVKDEPAIKEVPDLETLKGLSRAHAGQLVQVLIDEHGEDIGATMEKKDREALRQEVSRLIGQASAWRRVNKERADAFMKSAETLTASHGGLSAFVKTLSIKRIRQPDGRWGKSERTLYVDSLKRNQKDTLRQIVADRRKKYRKAG